MVKIRFYLLDIDYKEIAGKAAIYMYGRTHEGQRICIVDETFEPYFYAVPKESRDAEIAHLSEHIKKVKVEKGEDDFFVTKIEKTTKKQTEKERVCLKVFVNLPSGVPLIRSQMLEELDGIEAAYEYDIRFVRRYLIDKGLTPLTLLEAEVESIGAEVSAGERLRVPKLKASAVRQFSDDTLKPRILAFDIETYNPSGTRLIPEEHPIVMISVYSENFKKVLTWKQFDRKKENDYIEIAKSELEMLERFKKIVEEFAPDILIGYYSDGFDFPYIKTRADKYNLDLDFGLDHSELKIGGRDEKIAEITGFAHIDILKYIRKVAGKSAGGLKTDILTLEAVSNEVLGESKTEVDIEHLAKAWDDVDAEKLNKFCEYNLNDSRLAYLLCKAMLPNITEMVKIIGLPIADVNRMSFSQLVEWFAIKQARAANELVPNKPAYREQQYRTMTTIKGAFVFEPTPGFYKDIAVLDYRSLYPTIIASHNISIGTLDCKCCEGVAKTAVPLAEADSVSQKKNHWFCAKKKGFISAIIEDLITRRQRIKEIMKTEKALKGSADTLLDARSYALKVLANAFYGYLGFAPARWYCLECAESTTAWGRHYVKNVIESSQNEGFKVLYADTDSAFLLLGDKTRKDAERFVEKINKELPGLMELEVEGYYPSGIFVGAKAAGETGAKKKYAIMNEQGSLKIRGFETVRRNWSFVAKDTQLEILKMVLKEGNAKRAITYAKQIISDLRHNRIPLDKVVIFTKLQKEIDQYDSVGPHVAAAQRMKAKGLDVGPGSLIKFVIVKGKGKIRDKVKLPEEATQEEYDAEYYINNQIIPSVDRIFNVFGFDITALTEVESQQGLGQFL